MANLQASGFNTQLVHLKDGDYQEEFGKAIWRNLQFKKVYRGQKIEMVNPSAYDAWGITSHFSQHREVACMVIKHLAREGKPVIVGGSDAFAEPKPYIQAGARAVILDKSGAVNASVLDHVLKKKPRGKLTKVIFSNGDQPKGWLPLLRPEEWALPSINVAKQCLGYEYWREPFPQEMKPIGSVFSDIGCDRKCDFCQTPNYHLGYSGMSPKRTLQWVANQKDAGAR